ncbi:hypothetical protein ONR57_16040 [Hoyosella sp. YIM 151337]|uniref:hypothetical protein n=1 Tax=Hoyosella sp. YIM 151337 TaxID=2992742 RepID=UPI00223626CE|nr:hypothetical protein [Hoyosella sp. YIM 151337]MCW4354816.1 hypothetical protein [Hoyosella sp. YIM 151337]
MKIRRMAAAGASVAALTLGGLFSAAAAGQAQQPADCPSLPMGVAGLSLCLDGVGEHRIVMDCVDRVFPQIGGSSHGFTTMRVTGPWMPVGQPSFATCLGEGGMLPITQTLWVERR